MMMTINKIIFFWRNIQKNIGIKKPKILVLGSLIFLVSACITKDKFTLQTIQSDKGWSYEISLNNKVIIKQNHIPVISSNKLFFTEADAKKTGNFVKEKLETNQSPTLTKKDLFLLGIKM